MGAVYAVDFAYDPSGILTEMAYPSGRTVTFDPDAAGRIRKMVAEINGSSGTPWRITSPTSPSAP